METRLFTGLIWCVESVAHLHVITQIKCVSHHIYQYLPTTACRPPLTGSVLLKLTGGVIFMVYTPFLTGHTFMKVALIRMFLLFYKSSVYSPVWCMTSFDTYPDVLHTQILSGMCYAGLHLCRFLGLCLEIPRTITDCLLCHPAWTIRCNAENMAFHTKHTGSAGGGRHGYAVLHDVGWWHRCQLAT